MILDESMFMILFVKNIKFGDMMKLFYKFELDISFLIWLMDLVNGL